jgi:hypothetical protein
MSNITHIAKNISIFDINIFSLVVANADSNGLPVILEDEEIDLLEYNTCPKIFLSDELQRLIETDKIRFIYEDELLTLQESIDYFKTMGLSARLNDL